MTHKYVINVQRTRLNINQNNVQSHSHKSYPRTDSVPLRHRGTATEDVSFIANESSLASFDRSKYTRVASAPPPPAGPAVVVFFSQTATQLTS